MPLVFITHYVQYCAQSFPVQTHGHDEPHPLSGSVRGTVHPPCACMLSPFSCVWLCATLWTTACQALLSKGFSRQDYWSGLPCPPPGNRSDPGIKPVSLMTPALAGGFFTTSATWEALIHLRGQLYLLSIHCPPPWVPSTSLGQCPHVFSLFSISITSSLARRYFLLSYSWAF